MIFENNFSESIESNSILKKTLVGVSIPSQLEAIELDRTDGKRPDGLTLMLRSKWQCIRDFTSSVTFAKTAKRPC